MPSYLFDTDIFADIIMTVHADVEDIFFVSRNGGVETLLVDATFTETFRIYTMSAEGIPQEGFQTRVVCRSRDLPFPEPMDHRVRRGDRLFDIIGSEPNGIGMTSLILNER